MHSKYGSYITFHSPATSDTELTFVIEDHFSASPYKSTNGYSKENDKYTPILNGETEFNNIISANCNSSVWITKELSSLPHDVLEYLPQWEERALNAINQSIHRIDKKPLVESGISRRLRIHEFINVVFCGGHKTLYDKASIALSTPRRLYPCIDKIACFTGKLRRRLYLRLHR